MTFANTQARLRAMLPAISLVAVLIPILVMQPAVMSYFGSSLLLNLAVPIVLATLVLATTFTPIKQRLEAAVASRFKSPAAPAPGPVDASAWPAGAWPPSLDDHVRSIVREELRQEEGERDR